MNPSKTLDIRNAGKQNLLAVVVMSSEHNSKIKDQVLEIAGTCPLKIHAKRWLNKNQIFEMLVTTDGEYSAKSCRSLTEDLLAGMKERLRNVDIAVIPHHARQKKLLLCDMDSTVIGQECIDELASRAGVGAEVAEITVKSMEGRVQFEKALYDRIRLLKGLSSEVVKEILKDRITLNPGIQKLTDVMGKWGGRSAIISGGFTCFAEPVAKRAGFDMFRANVLEEKDGVFTGRLLGDTLGPKGKTDHLMEISASLGLTADDCIAVGDGANDREMLQLSGIGVAYRAKENVKPYADIILDYADLDAILYILGWSDEPQECSYE